MNKNKMVEAIDNLDEKYLTEAVNYKAKKKSVRPAVMSIIPTRDFTVNCSCRKTKASTRVMTTLSLSMGTTLETSPICSAL